MLKFISSLVVGAALVIGSAAAGASGAADSVVGTWTLDLAKSRFDPGPAPKSQTRTYAATADGIDLTVEGVAADGSKVSQHSSYKYDGKDYAITGAADYDTLSLKRIDANRVESEQKKGGKVVGHTVRTVSADGKTMTLDSKGTDSKGGKYKNVMVFDRK
ncbi:MAG TPA: hypothetical protein PL152_04650 [Steroidobacteraceae bacterium]|nr:hypothetical protein [Steroidobacteraceae bacterium]HQR48602.1 hypothetical protein [Steroidobacteraceae bacterium]